MKNPRVFPACLALGLIAALAGIFLPVNAADKKPAPSTTSASTSSLDIVIPKSVFTLNANNGTERKLKDPFFPRSTRTVIVPVVINTNVVPQVVTTPTDAFKLKGFSGIAGQEVVLINNRNFAKGESAEVTLDSGRKAFVRVIDIKATSYSAIIHPDGFSAPFEIFLPVGVR